MSEAYQIVLAKEDFKFSVAHFTIFGPQRAEHLHGHNYRVRVRAEGSKLDEYGLLLDIGPLKARIRQACSEFDEKTLLPRNSPLVSIAESGGRISLEYDDRRYDLPAAEVLLLPVLNVTLEELARLLWNRLAEGLDERLVELEVEVEETAGQSCLYRRRLPGRENGS